MRTFRLVAPAFRRSACLGLVCLFLAAAYQSMAGETNSGIEYITRIFNESHAHFQVETNNAETAWKFGRACFDMSGLQKDRSQEAKIAQQGISACRLAITLQSNSAAAHYYLGMNLGQFADTKRGLSALGMVKEMEREFLTARDLDEHLDHAGPDRNLGLLYRDAPIIVSIGSRTKARQHLEKAVELAPELPENHLNLIEAYLKWSDQAGAVRQLRDLEKLLPDARKQFTGDEWALTWPDWENRLSDAKKKLQEPSKAAESPHAAP
jgi:tetratricopeptide (TPR) repeat protein